MLFCLLCIAFMLQLQPLQNFGTMLSGKCYQEPVQNFLGVRLGIHMSKNPFVQLLLHQALTLCSKMVLQLMKSQKRHLKDGMIRAADQHSCSECTHQYKGTSDVITGGDLAATVGVDENTPVPAFVVNEGDRTLENEGQEQDITGNTQSPQDGDNMDIDYSPVKLVVMDGIVMGPNVCILTVTCN